MNNRPGQLLNGPAPLSEVGQVEVRIQKDAPLGERISQTRKHLEDVIQKAKWAGAKVQPDATAFVAMFLFLEEVVQRVESLEAEATPEIAEP